MSSKTLDIIQENKSLSEKIAKLTRLNSLIGQSEQEFVKKNQSNQEIIKMLVEKLRESDKMLEFAIENIPTMQTENLNGSKAEAMSNEYISDLTYVKVLNF